MIWISRYSPHREHRLCILSWWKSLISINVAKSEVFCLGNFSQLRFDIMATSDRLVSQGFLLTRNSERVNENMVKSTSKEKRTSFVSFMQDKKNFLLENPEFNKEPAFSNRPIKVYPKRNGSNYLWCLSLSEI